MGGFEGYNSIVNTTNITELNGFNVNSTLSSGSSILTIGIANNSFLAWFDQQVIFNSSDYAATVNSSITDMIALFPSAFNVHIGSWFDGRSAASAPAPDLTKPSVSDFYNWTYYDQNGTKLYNDSFFGAYQTDFAPLTTIDLPYWAEFGDPISSLLQSSVVYSQGDASINGPGSLSLLVRAGLQPFNVTGYSQYPPMTAISGA